MRRLSLTLATLCCPWATPLTVSAAAQDIITRPPVVDPASIPAVDDRALVESIQWLADWAMTTLPPTHRGEDGWGDTKGVWAGVDVRRDGWKIKTHRKWKQVNDGRWVRYELFPQGQRDAGALTATPIQLKIVNVTQIQQSWQIDATAIIPVDFTAQIQRWETGVKWYSVTVQGRLKARVDCGIRLNFSTDYSELPPAMAVDPHVQSARLTLEGFDIHRVSHLGGEVAEEIGVVVEKIIRRHLLEDVNDELVAKMNRGIDKHRAKLRLSLVSFLQRSLSPSAQATSAAASHSSVRD